MAAPVAVDSKSLAVPGKGQVWRAGLLLLPSAAVFSVFVFYPLVRTFWLGMHRTDPFGGQRYVGPSQFWDQLTSHDFLNSLSRTGLFVLYTVPVGIVVGMLLALLAHKQVAGIAIFRTIFSSTVATSVAVASVMWLALLNPNIGAISRFFQDQGWGTPNWLNDPGTALIAVAAMTIWLHSGATFILFLAGLEGLPQEVLEAASVDGAGPIRRFFSVTLPMLSPTVVFASVVLTINAFQSFGQIDIMTQGGPADSTNVVVYQIYKDAFKNFDDGAAAAQAAILFVIVLILTLIQLRFLDRRTHHAG